MDIFRKGGVGHNSKIIGEILPAFFLNFYELFKKFLDQSPEDNSSCISNPALEYSWFNKHSS